jgi:hypothetical protein
MNDDKHEQGLAKLREEFLLLAREQSDIVRTPIYISREAHERLREIADTTRQRVHNLIVEGIDLVLQKHGHSETARVTGRRRQPWKHDFT